MAARRSYAKKKARRRRHAKSRKAAFEAGSVNVQNGPRALAGRR
jgi:hypothetical protein